MMRKLWPGLILLPAVAACWIPFYFAAVVASRDAEAAASMPPPILPGANLLSNASRALELVTLFPAFANSLLVSACVAIGQAFLCSLAGFAFAKLAFRGRTVLFVFTLVALCIPTQLNVLPRYMLMGWLGWLDSLPALIVPGLASAFGVVWMRQHIAASLPDETMDAAALDGCGAWRTYGHVALPIIRPAAFTLAGIVFVGSWGEYLWPLLVTRSPATQTVQVALAALRSDYWVDHSLVFAGALVTSAPVIVLLLLASATSWRRR